MEHSIDFKNVFISSEDIKILSSARFGNIITVHPVSAKYLINYGFLSRYTLSESDNKFVITSLGIRYFEYLNSIFLEKSKQEKRFKLAELRSWVSLFISVIAIVISLLQWIL